MDLATNSVDGTTPFVILGKRFRGNWNMETPRSGSSRWLAGFIGLTLVAGIGTLAYALSTREAKFADDRGQKDPVALSFKAQDSTTVDMLAARVRALEAAASREKPAPSAQPEVPSLPELAGDPAALLEAKRAAQAQQRERDVERRQVLDAAMEKESTDAAWAGPMEEELDTILRSESFAGTTVTSTVCKESLCRVEAEHEDVANMHEFSGRVMETGLAFEHDMWGMDTEADGRSTSVFYVAREGRPKALQDIPTGRP